MLTLRQIAGQQGLSLWYMRFLARGDDFPPPRRVQGRNKLYAANDVARRWANHRKAALAATKARRNLVGVKQPVRSAA